MPAIYTRSAFALTYIASASAIAGAWFGATAGWATACVLLVIALARHVWYLERLGRWAEGPPADAVPEGRGIWRGVLDAVYRRQRGETQRRVRLARLLARSRQAGRALPYGVAILDHHYRIVWCNDSCESHFDIRLADDRGQTITHLVRQPDFV
ncbi:MAG TPA: phosphate regulon sensor protein PhoR, partial [Burkholderiales bacterium]|nr:phosphate regulon sensor protein PhoR [Burkholderiales bacterium]